MLHRICHASSQLRGQYSPQRSHCMGGGPALAHAEELDAWTSRRLHAFRWSRERYEGAVGALAAILRAMRATSADACVLRPALREEARKAIGARLTRRQGLPCLCLAWTLL